MSILCEGSSCPHEVRHYYKDRNGTVWAFCDLHVETGIYTTLSRKYGTLTEITREEYIVEPVMKS